MTKEIYTRKKLKNKQNSNSTEENQAIYKNKEINVYFCVERRLACIWTMWRKLASKQIKTFGN